MRTTATLDDKLFKAVCVAVGTTDRSVVMREALHAPIKRDAAKRLARLGGSDPQARALASHLARSIAQSR
jgi:Arc/MetJ family transcription regulator